MYDTTMSCQEALALEGRLAGLAGAANVAQAQLVDAVREAINNHWWHGDGIRSVAHWLTIQLG